MRCSILIRVPTATSRKTHNERIDRSSSVGNVLTSELKIARIDHIEKKNDATAVGIVSGLTKSAMASRKTRAAKSKTTAVS